MTTALGALIDAADSPPISVAVVESPHSIATLGAATGRVFQAGSISKCVTALIALRLAGDGLLHLDEPVNDTLRTWQIRDGDSVTLRQLLTHTAGVGVPFFPGYEQGHEVPSLVQVLNGEPPANTAPVRIEKPRTEFRYSGGGYTIVQQLIEDAAHESFDHVADQVVFVPLAMSDSTFEQPPRARYAERAARHDWHIYPEKAAAGLWTTPRDLAMFASTIQQAAAGMDAPVQRASAQLMISPSTHIPPDGDWAVLPSLGIRGPDHYGMGFFLEGDNRFSHLGGAHGFFSLLTASSKDGTAGVVMSASDPTPRLFEVALALSDHYGWSDFRANA